MTDQPPIKTWRAGVGCATTVVVAVAPFGMYTAMGGTATSVRYVAAGVSLLLAILFGPFLIGWVLSVDTVPAHPDVDEATLTPGPGDPIHFIAHDDRDARRCRDTGTHDPHPYFWTAWMPYTVIKPGGKSEEQEQVLSGGTWCRGHR
jgi:hypothetical protein